MIFFIENQIFFFFSKIGKIYKKDPQSAESKE